MSHFPEETYADDQKLAQGVFACLKASKAAYSILHNDVWPRGYKHYHNRHDPKMFQGTDVLPGPNGTEYPLDKAVFRPETYTQVEAKIWRLRGAILAADPPFKVQACISDFEFQDKDERDASAQSKQHLLATQWHKDIRIRKLCGPMLRDAARFGTAVLRLEWFRRASVKWQQVPRVNGEVVARVPKGTPRSSVTWSFETAKVEVPSLDSGRPAEIREAGPQVYEDRPRVVLVPIWNFYPDPFGRSIDGEDDSQPCRWVIELVIMPAAELASWIMATPERGWNKKFYKTDDEGQSVLDKDAIRAAIDKVKGGITADDDWVAQQQVAVGKRSKTGLRETPEDRQLVRLVMFWENNPDPRLVMVAGKAGGGDVFMHETDQHPARLAGIPYVLIKPIPLGNELFGLSSTEQLAGLQHEINILVNLRVCALTNAVDGITLVNNNAGIYKTSILGQPRGMVDVSGYVPLDQCLHHVDFKDPGSAVYREVDELRNSALLTGGSPDPMMGNATGSDQGTARGLLSAVEQGTGRSQDEAEEVGENLSVLGQKLLRLDRQHITRTRYVRIAGKKGAAAWDVVDPSMLCDDDDVVFNTRPVETNPTVVQQSAMNFGQLCGQMPGFPTGEYLRTMAKMANMPNAEAYGTSGPDQALMENAEFINTGQFRNVLPTDDHPQHRMKHNTAEILAWAEAKGAQAKLAMFTHDQQHQQAMGMPTSLDGEGGGAAPPEAQPPMAPPEGGQPPGAAGPPPLPAEVAEMPMSEVAM